MFCDDLFYKFNRKLNNSERDIYILQEPCAETLLAINQMKSNSMKGYYQPMYIDFIEKYGFCVKAFRKINAFTLICEYVGDVSTSREYMFSKKDDIMRLLITRRSRTSLDIVPEIHANIGRFICSVTKETQSQKNVFNYIVFYLYLM